MPGEPFPAVPAGGQEPERSTPLPGPGSGPPEPEDQQGLFVCLPAENMELSRFGGDDQGAPMAPGPLLAMVAAAVSDGDGSGLAQVPEEVLFSVISGGRRMASWGTWLEFSAMRELALRHPVVPRTTRRTAPQAPAGRQDQTPAAPQVGASQAGGDRAASGPAATPQPPDTQQSLAAPQLPAGSAEAGSGATGSATGAAGSGGPGSATEAADDGRVLFADFVADEVALELRMSWHGAADRMTYACALAGRLPVTFAALGAGLIDPVHAKIIFEQTDILSAADAAKADPVLAAAAQHKTYAELRAAAAKLVLKLDPDSHERRKQARRQREAHVRPFREESGNAGIIGRELPSDEVLASWQNVKQRALALRAAGVPGTLRELRIQATFDLLQERDSRLAAGPAPGQRPAAGNAGPQDSPGSDGPGPDGPGGPGGSGLGPRGVPAGPGRGGRAHPAGKDSGPVLAALVNITVPLATVLGQSGTPGEAAGFGLLDAGTAADLLAAAARSPRTRWCVTVLHPDGTAAAHGCAAGRHPAPPGPEPPGPEPPGPEPPGPEPPEPESEPPGPEPEPLGPEPLGPEPEPLGPEPLGPEPEPLGPETLGPEPSGPAAPGTGSPGTAGPRIGSGSGGPDRLPPEIRAQEYLRSLRVRLALIAHGVCDHRHAEAGYRPSRKLRHLVRTRSTTCSAPGCGRAAARCDLDHTLAWDKGGMTCECDLAPLCRHHHRCKQAEGWQLTQPEPGVLIWRTPHGRTYATTPSEYAF